MIIVDLYLYEKDTHTNKSASVGTEGEHNLRDDDGWM